MQRSPLVYFPISSARKLHQCTILTRKNKKFIIRSYSYISPANFKEQTEEYLELLILLHEKTKSFEDIAFNKGINIIGYWSFLVFLLIMSILMIVIAVVLYQKHKYSEISTSIMVVILFMFMIHTYIQNFKP